VELIGEMLRGFFDDGCEVVIAARTGRDDPFGRVLASRLFYGLVRLGLPEMPARGFDFFLLGRRALERLLARADGGSFLQAEVLRTGFAFRVIGYRRRRRAVGRSRWRFSAKVGY